MGSKAYLYKKYMGSNSNPSVIQLVGSCYTNCTNPAPIMCLYMMYIINSTYASKMRNNFIFNYLRNRNRWKNEKIKKETGKTEHSPFILAVVMNSSSEAEAESGFVFTWALCLLSGMVCIFTHSMHICISLSLFSSCGCMWLNSCKLNVHMMRLLYHKFQ